MSGDKADMSSATMEQYPDTHQFLLADPHGSRIEALQRSMEAMDVKHTATRSIEAPPSFNAVVQEGKLSQVTCPSQKLEEAKEICERLTLKEKVGLCSGRDMWNLKPVRKELSSVLVSDGPHGVRKQGAGDLTDFVSEIEPATCFPTASCSACSWDPDLLRDMGVALGTESVQSDITVLLGPGMNIKRHPCGGRNFEYFSEDPLLSGRLAAALVEGIQSQGVGTCIKHFCANNEEWARMRVDVQVDERTLREIYWRAFEMVIRDSQELHQQPWTIMCAYNKLNGTYCSEHEELWKMVREEWGFRGVVMTDWGATNDRVGGLNAGVDLEMPGSLSSYDSKLRDAVRKGTISEETLDATVTRNLALSIIGQDIMDTRMDVNMDAHHELARKVSMESAVLLKNENNLLPLARDTSIAVIGDFARKPRYQGMGSSQVFPTKVDCSLDRLKEHTNTLIYATGYDRESDVANTQLIDEAVAAAEKANVAIIFCGLPEIDESEGFDRAHMGMSASHNAVIEAVCSVNPRTVVVLSNGAPVTMPWVDKPEAILEGYLAGQAGGSALVDLMFGVASPCGKLAETFPLKQEDHASDANFPGEHFQVQYREGLNVGYRHFDSSGMQVLFPFGHGLTYTKFEYRNLQTTIVGDAQVQVTFTLANVGSVRAAEITQCYVHDVESSVYRPEQELAAFSKVWLDPGQEQTVEFTLDKRAFSFYDMGVKDWIVEPGAFEIRVGASSRDLRLQSKVEISSGQVPSERAQQAHPPVKHAAILEVTGTQFCTMLGVDTLPPPVKRSRPYHYNTLLGEIKYSIWGSILKGAVFKAAMQNIEDDQNKLQKKLMKEICDAVPMRGLVIFSQGGLTFQELDMILALMNWRLHKVVPHAYPIFKERRRRLAAHKEVGLLSEESKG